jgi:hypothetical protein
MGRKMKAKSLLVAVAALAAVGMAGSPAFASTTVGSTDGGNCYPFVCNDSGTATGQSIDYYQIYSSSAFSGPLTFNTISFADTILPGAEILTGNYAISFGVTSSAVGSGYPVSISGVGSFFSGALGGPNLSITGSSYAYNPLSGNLVMHVVASNQANTPNGSQANGGYMDADYAGLVTSRAYYNIVGTENGSGALVTTFSGGAVPEPATWAMMLVGFGGLGAALRSRRKLSMQATV